MENIQELYQTIINRLLENAMFHDASVNLHNFFGLNGFKRIFQYHFRRDMKHYEEIKMHYTSRHNRILASPTFEVPTVYPATWTDYTQFDVTEDTFKKYVQANFEKARDRVLETKGIFSKVEKEFMASGNADDFDVISCLFKDLYQEQKRIDRISIQLKMTDYNMEYIMEIQPELHTKYKKKMGM